MCGIAGIISKNSNDISLSKIKKMTDEIKHRGPDSEGYWISECNSICLGHRRLSIIDLSIDGHQPMHFQERYTISFNGEIYNYIEIRQELEREGYLFKTNTDTEVLLTLYHKDGESCLNKLDGMWAFAIWDSQEKELFCARDRFGEKPFYFAFKENEYFVFGSEMKSIWAYGIKKEVLTERIDLFSISGKVYDVNDLSNTFYQNIFSLQNSHWLKVTKDLRIIKQRYYDINWQSQDFKGSFLDATEEFKRLFQISLRRRCRSDVAIGTSLSGGLDSSSIVCEIKNIIDNNIVTPHTFSARFHGYNKDEGYYIEKVIEKTGAIPHYTWPNGEEMYHDFQKMCWHQEEPFGSASIYAQYRVQQEAKSNNITVLIDGQGADEILAGYVDYYTYYLLGLQKNQYFIERLKEQTRYIDFHTPHKGVKNTMMKIFFFYEFKHKWIAARERNIQSINELMYNAIMNGGLQELLRYADRNSMAHSREVRLPFLFHELVQFCFSLPDEFKLYRGWTKYVMRKAFEEILPKEITWRKDKIGFEPPQSEWMKAFGSSHTWRDIMINKFSNV